MSIPPLTGVRVLDLSRVLAGPWATQALADLGAEVIKVERPGAGDDTRAWGPPFVADAAGEPGDAAYFFAANRNKRSIAIDFASPEGAELVRALAMRSQIVVENFKPGALAKFGLDAASLRAAKPSLVIVSITGFGQSGPYRDRAGYDVLAQAMGGFMSLTGAADGPPTKAGVATADLFAGMYAALSAVAALRRAEASGIGAHLDVSLLDCQLATLANQAAYFFAAGAAPRRMGDAHPTIVPYQSFAAADAPLVIAVGNDQQFRAFCDVAGLQALAADARFAANAGRVRHREELLPQIAARLAQEPRAFWVERLNAAGVPCGPIYTLDEAFADPNIAARGLIEPLTRVDGAHISAVRFPAVAIGEPPRVASAPPRLGADTADVLREVLGCDEAEIARLVRERIAAAA